MWIKISERQPAHSEEVIARYSECQNQNKDFCCIIRVRVFKKKQFGWMEKTCQNIATHELYFDEWCPLPDCETSDEIIKIRRRLWDEWSKP